MMRSILIPVILLCSMLSFFPSWTLGKSVDIIAYGDSITQGLGRGYDNAGNPVCWGVLKPTFGQVNATDSRLGIPWGYPTILNMHMEQNLHTDLRRTTPFSVTVYNWGYGGYTSADALDCDNQDPQKAANCIDNVLASQSSDFILILLGANDLYTGIQADVTVFNIQQIIAKCKESGVEPILGTITPNTNNRDFLSPTIIESYYNPEIRQLAEDEEILLTDHYNLMLDEWETRWTSGDGLHLGAEGNNKLAGNWYLSLLQSPFFKVVHLPFLMLLND